MNFPSASPNENMNIDSSINPMPARRAERSSNPVEIFANTLIRFSAVGGSEVAYQVAETPSSVIPGAPTGPRQARPDDRLRANAESRDSGFSPAGCPGRTGHERLPRRYRCDTDRPSLQTQENPAMTEF